MKSINENIYSHGRVKISSLKYTSTKIMEFDTHKLGKFILIQVMKALRVVGG
jgi:hypothetical protein